MQSRDSKNECGRLKRQLALLRPTTGSRSADLKVLDLSYRSAHAAFFAADQGRPRELMGLYRSLLVAGTNAGKTLYTNDVIEPFPQG